jgi:hypothetical protein
MNNRTLLIIFISCLVLFLAGKLLTRNKTSSFDPVIIEVDTAAVSRIQFISAGESPEEFQLNKTEGNWQAVRGNMTVPAARSAVNPILTNIVKLHAQRLVTKDPDRYSEFEISDDQAGRMMVWTGKKKVADLCIGGFRFDQAARTASSFIRHSDRPEVYVIDGFQSMGFKPRFDQFRDRKLVNVNAEDLTNLEWSDSFGNKKVIQKIDGEWHYAGMEAVDSSSFANYLNTLSTATGSEFSDVTMADGLSLIEKLILTGNNMIDPTIITAYKSQDTLKPFLIHSTANPEAIFTSDSAGLQKRIFSDLRVFWPDGK